jgi:hypothetical protein
VKKRKGEVMVSLLPAGNREERSNRIDRRSILLPTLSLNRRLRHPGGLSLAGL